MNNEQQEYVKGELALGVTPEKIRNDLIGAGYTADQVTELLDFAQTSQSQIPEPSAVLSTPVAVKKSAAPRVIFYVCVLFIVFGMLGFILNSLNSASDSALDASEKISLSNLRNQAEIHSISNIDSEPYAGFCESSAVRNFSSTNATLECIDSATQYQVSIQLNGGAYFCIDNFGTFTELDYRPLDFSCKSSGVAEVVQDEDELIRNAAPSTQNSFGDTENNLFSVSIEAMFYHIANDSSYVGFCESAEVQPILNKIQNAECVESIDMYMAIAGLPTGGYYCVDGTGFSDRLEVRSDGLQCDPNDNPVNKFLIQAEQIMFPDSSKTMRKFYKENNQSYQGACSYMQNEMLGSGLEFDCVANQDQYRVSALLSDGSYQCIAESPTSPATDVYNSQINVSLAQAPVGFECE